MPASKVTNRNKTIKRFICILPLSKYAGAFIGTLYFISEENASAYMRLRKIFYHLIRGVMKMSVKDAVVKRFREIMAQRNMRPSELANL